MVPPARRTSALAFLLLAHSANAFQRAIGAKDARIGRAVKLCVAGGDPNYVGVPLGYGGGVCPNLIDCIMDNLNAADQAGLSAGASIAALLPTVLALAGKPLSNSRLNRALKFWMQVQGPWSLCNSHTHHPCVR